MLKKWKKVETINVKKKKKAKEIEENIFNQSLFLDKKVSCLKISSKYLFFL